MMYWNDGSAGWVGWVVMIVAMIAFWGLLAWVGVSLIRATAKGAQPGASVAPDELLAERFARGEIKEDDYLHRSEVLRQQRPTAR